MTIISKNTSTKCLQCIKHDNYKESHSCEKIKFNTYFLQIQVLLSKLSTDLDINAIMMVISQKFF